MFRQEIQDETILKIEPVWFSVFDHKTDNACFFIQFLLCLPLLYLIWQVELTNGMTWPITFLNNTNALAVDTGNQVRKKVDIISKNVLPQKNTKKKILRLA